MKIGFLVSKLSSIQALQKYGLICLLFLFACGPARHLQDDEKLLTKVKVKTKGKFSYSEELKSISKQKPNRKLLGLFKIYLGFYNLYYHKEDSRIKEKLGEPPVIYDSSLTANSVDLMNKYLNNKGFYENKVEAKVKDKFPFVKKRAKLSFTIDKGPRYTISHIQYKIQDGNISNVFNSDSSKTHLKVGGAFDLESLKKERLRIERLLKNHGYYAFSKEYVIFEVDTFKATKTAELTLRIKNQTIPSLNADTLVEKPHQTFKISKVYVRMDYTAQNVNQLVGDTTFVDSMYFIDLKGDKFNKKAISRITYIRPGNDYRLDLQEQTYRNLSALRVFSYVSIQYEPDYDKGENYLIAYIDLNPRKQKSLTLETEGTNNGGNLGLNGTVTFQNNNTFKGAEILNVSMNGGLEAQQILTQTDDEELIDGFLPFNTVEFGPELSLEVPRFLLPGNADRFSPRGNPRTTFNASYNFQERPDYKRNVTKVFIAYSWNESSTKTHIIQPFDLSYIKLEPTQAFKDLLESIENPFVKNSYTDNLIMALKYSFIFNNKTTNKLKDYIFFRGNIESAGNLLALGTNWINNDQDADGLYRVLDIQYAQYLRSDIDFRYYQQFNFSNLVYRFSTGLGLPYGNSLAMPFEKSFYAGGANGIRAWRARELGPGNLPDSTEKSIDQIGNMNLEANVEFRFPITNVIEGAAFVDAGNIWNLDQDDSRKDTQFKFNNFLDGTAVGIGTGIRLNFTFFIFRLDVATKVKDPSLKNPNIIRPQWRQSNLNFGIGYPF